ncbi:hypothetical protein AMELA_G00232820 [Ameiurus melas]|uniref:CD99 antigen-like protein 2 n=1 Tax=Ameiurus melas TaxID=219545 RepID=A0A7J5ZZF4_AMEME|nr:hypothetical protein AMELA_G00232820 [Ameiurus melas]
MTPYVWILLFGALALTNAQDLDLSDALGDDEPTPTPAVKPPKAGGDDLDLSDALLPDPEKPKDKDPKQPAVPAQGGGDLSDSDLLGVGEDGYQPDPGRGSRAGDNTDDRSDTQDDQPRAAEGGQMAGIISAVAVAIFGAASSYFAYQKKKLCFKVQGGTDPESGVNQSGMQSDPQSKLSYKSFTSFILGH